jgi:nitroreductase
MEVIEAIRSRRSIRSFKPDPVPKEVLEELLDACRWAPNSSNTQPWEFAVLGGKAIEEAKDRLVERVKAEWDSSGHKFRKISPDIPTPELPEPYLHRAMALRAHIDNHQFPPGTEDLDKKRRAYLLYGSRFYGAPNLIILYAEKSLYPKTLIDTGIMAETIAITALSYGLGTCLMSMPVYWPDIYRDLLKVPESKLIALAIPIGYQDSQAVVNTFQRNREPLNTFTHWHGI